VLQELPQSRQQIRTGSPLEEGEPVSSARVDSLFYLTVKRGVGYERDYIAWLQWVMAILEERVKQQREERASE
jgi:hypothetical protein